MLADQAIRDFPGCVCYELFGMRSLHHFALAYCSWFHVRGPSAL